MKPDPHLTAENAGADWKVILPKELVLTYPLWSWKGDRTAPLRRGARANTTVALVLCAVFTAAMWALIPSASEKGVIIAAGWGPVFLAARLYGDWLLLHGLRKAGVLHELALAQWPPLLPVAILLRNATVWCVSVVVPSIGVAIWLTGNPLALCLWAIAIAVLLLFALRRAKATSHRISLARCLDFGNPQGPWGISRMIAGALASYVYVANINLDLLPPFIPLSALMFGVIFLGLVHPKHDHLWKIPRQHILPWADLLLLGELWEPPKEGHPLPSLRALWSRRTRHPSNRRPERR